MIDTDRLMGLWASPPSADADALAAALHQSVRG